MDHQTLLVRRLVAAGAVVLVVVLLVVLIKGCVDSQREAALKDYNRNVRALAEQSRSEVSRPLFEALGGAAGRNQQQVQETISQLTSTAQEQLAQAQRLDVPDTMKGAQSDFELLLGLRRDGVSKIADLIQPALAGTAGAGAAVDRIAGEMQAFEASDVIWSQRVAPLILKGLKDNGIAASYDGTAGEQVLPYSAFLPDISWLSPDYVGGQLGAAASSTNNGRPAPGLHGHSLDSVTVNGTTLTSSGSNKIPASPPPTFTVNFTNGGQNNETNVKVTVEVDGPSGAPIRAQKVVPTTTPGQSATADVQLPSSPSTAGASTIRVTIAPVPGERTLDNNTATYSALFE